MFKKTIFLFIFLLSIFLLNKKIHIIEDKIARVLYFLNKDNYQKEEKKVLQDIKRGEYFFEKNQLSFIKFKLEDFGVKFPNKITRPVGYLDIYENKIILVTFDGKIFLTNDIKEIKNGNLILKKIYNINNNLFYIPSDNNSYRAISIRDILVDNKKIYIVTNGKKIKNKQLFGSTKVLYADLTNLNEKTEFKIFFQINESVSNIQDWSHTGGRIIKFKNKFILAVPDYKLEYSQLIKAISNDKSIIGKTIMIDEKGYKIFSRGHRNIQGLYYDSELDQIISTEHGPTGGDEINIIQENKHYGWPLASYGTLGYGYRNHPRKHKKLGYAEPLYYWWPFNCAPSQITVLNKNFIPSWERSLIVACLSGKKHFGKSIYRFEFEKKNKILKKAKYFIDDRVRDLKYSETEKTLILLLENKRVLGLIFKN